MRVSSITSLAAILVLQASSALADDFSRPATFRELFGVDEVQAETMFGAELSRCLSGAWEDFNLALASKQPINSKTDMSSFLTDGGTVNWRGACFDLTILKGLTSYELPDGSWVHGYVQGPSLRLKLGGKTAQNSGISRTRFVLLQKEPPKARPERARE